MEDDMVYLKRVYWGVGNLQQGIQTCMFQFGYGYDRIVYIDEDNAYAFLATESVRISDNEVDMVNDYLSGGSQCQYLVDLDNKHIKVED